MCINRIHGQKTKSQEGTLLVDLVEKDSRMRLLAVVAIRAQCNNDGIKGREIFILLLFLFCQKQNSIMAKGILQLVLEFYLL